MKKKIIVCLLLVLLTTGCTTVQKSAIPDIINRVINNKQHLCNHIKSGYKFYLPRGLESAKVDENNEIINSKHETYYLYINLIGYNRKKEVEYKANSEFYYSEVIKKDDKEGILNIRTTDNNNYIVQVIYNYARIEVETNEANINKAVMNALVMVTTIEYNDSVIQSLIGKSSYKSSEEVVSIFDNRETESNSLEVDDSYSGNEEEEYDPDIIN